LSYKDSYSAGRGNRRDGAWRAAGRATHVNTAAF